MKKYKEYEKYYSNKNKNRIVTIPSKNRNT